MSANKMIWAGALTIGSLGTIAHAGTLTLEIEIPQQNVVEYHKPYLAGWIEGPGVTQGTIFVWYDVKKREGAGQKWLPDLRSWWRKAGRDLTLPIDGVSGATRAPGRQVLTLDTAKTVLKDLKPGAYTLVVEADREAGGHDLVKLPLNWNAGKAVTVSGRGEGELGAIKLTYKP